MSYDNICKFLAEQYPLPFAQWLLGTTPETVQLLKTELSQEPIRADSLTLLQTTSQILHLEFQSLPKSKPSLPFRMLDYSVRLKREYQLSVIQFVVFLKETATADVFVESYEDETTIHRYNTIRMWEQEPALFLENLALLPFAVLTRTDEPQELLREVADRVVRIEDNQQRANLASCVEILAGLRFDRNLIHQLLREETMQESVIYQDILQKGLERGMQQGLQQGLQQGEAAIVLRLLRRRFGDLAPEVENQIQSLSLEQLEALGDELLDFSQLSDLTNWLEQQDEPA